MQRCGIVLSFKQAAAEAEKEENKQEQRRQNKRHVKYGQIIQVRWKGTIPRQHVKRKITSRYKAQVLSCMSS